MEASEAVDHAGSAPGATGAKESGGTGGGGEGAGGTAGGEEGMRVACEGQPSNPCCAPGMPLGM